MPATDTFFTEAQRARIIGHMNEDHADAVLGYARHFGGVADAAAARLDDLDQTGMSLTVTLSGGEQAVRVDYPQPLDAPGDAHHMLVDMAQTAARSAPAGSGNAPGDENLARARETAQTFRAGFRTVILGTVSEEGIPDASVSAAVLGEDGAFYVYVSALSAHTRNLGLTGKASVFLIQDESESKNLLARKRLTFPCEASPVARGSEVFNTRMAALKEKFGPVMEHLEGMTDFQMIRLQPARGRLVNGFGQAYDIDPLDWIRLSHVGDVGHSHTTKA
jgi:putative heme iron utilization protein